MHYIISAVQILTIYSLILNVECCIRTVPSDEVTLPPPTDLTTEFTVPTEETTTDAEQTDSTDEPSTEAPTTDSRTSTAPSTTTTEEREFIYNFHTYLNNLYFC